MNSQIARIEVPTYVTAAEAAQQTWQLARTLWRLAFDDSIRVVVMSDSSVSAGKDSRAGSAVAGEGSTAIRWRLTTAVLRVHYAFALMDKPVIGHFTGDIEGPVGSLMLAADLIVVGDHVRFRRDGANGEPGLDGFLGDLGGGSLLPLFLTPGRAKEFALTQREYGAAELETLGLVNYVLPVAQTWAKVDELAAGLLRRPAYALAATKRVTNKPVLHQLNRSLDAGFAYSAIAALEG